MSDERNRIYLQHPTKQNALLPAQLLKEEDGLISMRLLEELTLPAQSETKQFFHDQHDLFYGFECTVLRMESAGPNPVVSVKQTGPRERHENRETFRIPVYDDIVTVTLEDRYAGAVFDIGYNGLAAVIDYDGLRVDNWIKVEIEFDCVKISGRASVIYRKSLNDGRFRYGLKADPLDKTFGKELSRITQALQNLKARRASRLGTNNLHVTRVGEDSDDDTVKAMEQAARGQSRSGITNRRERRMHDRKAWEGPAKVYILEERQLRVLEVSTVDLSQGGMCFLSKQYIYEGTEVLFEKPVPNGLFRVCASIQSIALNNDGIHRVGLQFVGAPLKPGEVHEKYYMV